MRSKKQAGQKEDLVLQTDGGADGRINLAHIKENRARFESCSKKKVSEEIKWQTFKASAEPIKELEKVLLVLDKIDI